MNNYFWLSISFLSVSWRKTKQEGTAFTSKGFYFVWVELLDALCGVACDRTAGQGADGEESVKHRLHGLLRLHLLKHQLVHRQWDPHSPQGAPDHYWGKKRPFNSQFLKRLALKLKLLNIKILKMEKTFKIFTSSKKCEYKLQFGIHFNLLCSATYKKSSQHGKVMCPCSQVGNIVITNSEHANDRAKWYLQVGNF